MPPTPEVDSTPARGRVWDWPPADLMERPLPHIDRVTRFFVRVGLRRSLQQVIEVRGLEYIEESQDPFLVVANHSQRFEAVMLPAILMWHRHGRRIYYMADWPMMLVPGVGLMYRAGKIIPVFNKSAKPPFLNALKPLYQRRHPGTAWERASAILQAGHPVGVFPEGTMNRHPRTLLRGRAGAAMLALENGVPVVPVGIRFPENDGTQPIGDRDRMTIEVAPPITADADRDGNTVSKRAAVAFHEKIMRELERLSGKAWNPRGPRRRIQHVA
ncbi:MAG: lysophospholipid acyltransferase family protein [Acidobacteriota bacterium]